MYTEHSSSNAFKGFWIEIARPRCEVDIKPRSEALYYKLESYDAMLEGLISAEFTDAA